MKIRTCLLVLLFVVLGFNNTDAQIVVSDHVVKNNAHKVYSYGLGEPQIWMSSDSIYCLRFDKAVEDDLGQNANASSFFYLSDNKVKAVKALSDFAEAVKGLDKNESITITDFKGVAYIISYADKMKYGKPKVVLFNFYNPHIHLMNKYGTEFVGARYIGSSFVLERAIKKQSKWK